MGWGSRRREVQTVAEATKDIPVTMLRSDDHVDGELGGDNPCWLLVVDHDDGTTSVPVLTVHQANESVAIWFARDIGRMLERDTVVYQKLAKCPHDKMKPDGPAKALKRMKSVPSGAGGGE